MRMLCAQGGYIFGGFRDEHRSSSARHIERRKDGGRFSFADGSDSAELIIQSVASVPHVARGQRDFRDVALSLPASYDGAREFRVVRNDQDAGLIERTRGHSPAFGPCLRVGVSPFPR